MYAYALVGLLVRYNRTLTAKIDDGNFDYLNAADAADDNAFALSSTDHRWNYITATSNAWIPAFRCYLSSSSIEKNTYQSRFTE